MFELIFKLKIALKGVSWWRNVIAPRGASIENPKLISSGGAFYLGPGVTILCRKSIRVGRGVIIGPRVFITDYSHDYLNANYKPYGPSDSLEEVIIGDAVWVGYSSIILPGVTIGEGAVLAAGSVLTKNVGPYELWAGNPARLIKKLPKKPDGSIYYLERNKQLG